MSGSTQTCDLAVILGDPSSIPRPTGKEIEQKYYFGGGADEDSSFALACQDSALKQVRFFIEAGGGGIVSRPYSGTDYCFNVEANGSLFSLRYRLGDPMNNYLCIKKKNLQDEGPVREEVEFLLAESVTLETALSFLKLVASMSSNSSGSEIELKGDIFLIPFESGWIEITISLIRHSGTGKLVCIGEIEALAFEDEEAAKAKISELEKVFAWEYNKTSLNTLQLMEI